MFISNKDGAVSGKTSLPRNPRPALIGIANLRETLAAAQPVADLLTAKYGEHSLPSTIMNYLVENSKAIVTRTAQDAIYKAVGKFAFSYFFEFFGGPAGWVLMFAIEFVKWEYRENAMKVWCRKSTFRPDKKEFPYKDADTEISELFKAITEA